MSGFDVMQCVSCGEVYAVSSVHPKPACPECQEAYAPGDEIFECETEELAFRFIHDVKLGVDEALKFLPYKRMDLGISKAP